MGIRDVLRELLRQVRGGTLELLAAAPEDWLTWSPPGTSNHILWHAGHAVWLQDVLCLQPLTGRSELPAGWEETFGMDCRPVRLTHDWPKRDRLQQVLELQQDRLFHVLGSYPFEQKAQREETNLVSRIVHGLHDEARHQGEMYLLLKQRRAGLAGQAASPSRE